MEQIYIVKSKEFHKIGYTDNLGKRITQLKTGNPFDIQIIFTHEDKSARDIEIYLHKKFSEKRVNGEWFLLDEDDIEAIKKEAILGFINVEKKIRRKKSDYIIMPKKSNKYISYLIDSLGFAYIGYLYLLSFSVDCDSKIYFDSLLGMGIKPGMISVCKKQFIRAGVVKKHNGYYYLNPAVAIKGESINPNVIELFK